MDNNMTKMEYEKAIEYILSQIKTGELAVGSKLPPERVIADTLSIGRNSTREAISILHGMGMIERKQGSGNYISENANETMCRMLGMMLALGTISKRDICEFRRAMEKTACMLIMQKELADDYAKQFRAVLDDMRASTGSKQAELDRQYHIMLMEATENAVLKTIMGAVITIYREWIVIALEKADTTSKKILQQCHEDIIAGLIEKNEKTVNTAIDRHYNLIETLIY